MKNNFHLLLLSVVFGAYSTASYSQDLYNTNSISEIEIDFYNSNWDAILDSYMAIDSDERILAGVRINDVLFDSVGVRYKGNSSYNANRIKNPLNIKLNYIKDQDYDGYYTLKLSNGFKDPSFVRETLAWEISRKYMPSSLAGYANITINGNLIGLYTNVQSVNDVFTNQHYYSEDRPFFEGSGDGPRPTGCFYYNWDYLGPDSTSCYTYYYESKSGDYYTQLISFLDIFNNDISSLEEVYNVDRHLWAMAFDIGLVNLDAPISMAHNFYLYYDNTDRFNYIKWDMNECFGVFQRLENKQLNTLQMQQLDPFTNNNSANPIVSKVWQNDRWKKMYMAHLRTIIEETFEEDWYMERALILQSVIDDAVQDDPNKFFSYSDFTNNLDRSIDRTVGISELMEARKSYLENTVYFQYTQPDISKLSITPETITLDSDVVIQANITNAEYAYLGYRSIIGGIFEKAEMFDDGAHQDGSSGDGIWAVEIPIESSFLEYYIYAENDDAGKFSPERAEHEFYSLNTSNDIVINEFMASNSTSIEDQDGEYDDWIELYNNSASDISLNGCYLSDDLENPTKWSFPDISIDANGYLIIWADKDTLQEGLHCNFKLSASGESIIFSDASEQVMDFLSFPSQSTDDSYGRYVNGTGSFEYMDPSFAAENMQRILDIADNKFYIPELLLYPNPAKHKLTVSIDDDLDHRLRIINLSGQLLESLEMRNSINIDVSHLQAGFYFINIDGIATEKFIKR